VNRKDDLFKYRYLGSLELLTYYHISFFEYVLCKTLIEK
jgi:hypothetical protein